MAGKHHEIVRLIQRVITDRAALRVRGGFLEFTHRFSIPGSGCRPGEVVFDVAAFWAGRRVSLPYSSKQLAMIDYLRRHKIAQNAGHIVAGMHTDPFFVNYGRNARRSPRFNIRINRTSVRADIEQLRKIAVIGFRELKVEIDPKAFIQSIKTEREVRYLLRARVVEPIRHIEY